MNKCYKKHPLRPDDSQDDDVVADISGDINTEGSDALTKRSEALIYHPESAEEQGIRNPGLDYACDSDFWMTLCNAENVWTAKEFVPQTSYFNCMASCKEMHMKDEAEKAEKARKEESEGGSLSKRFRSVDEATTVLDAGLANVEAESERGTTLATSKLTSATVSLTKRNDFPYNGQLGEANDNDNHHCNNTWVQVKCSAKAMFTFWSYKKHYFGCIAECVIERDGDNWTEEDAECDGGEQAKL